MNDSVLVHKAFQGKLTKIPDLSDTELIEGCQRIFDTLTNVCNCVDTYLLDFVIMEALFYHHYLLELDKRGVTPP